MRYLILLSTLICSPVFALSCPNTGSILQEGDSIAQVIARCGEPVSRTDAKVDSNTGEKWVYYRNHRGGNTKITLTFKGDRLTKIHVLDTTTIRNKICHFKNQYNQMINVPCQPYDRYVSTTGFCQQIVQTGQTMGYVRSVCGNPADSNATGTSSEKVTEFVYKGTKPNILVFTDGKLSNWKE